MTEPTASPALEIQPEETQVNGTAAQHEDVVMTDSTPQQQQTTLSPVPISQPQAAASPAPTTQLQPQPSVPSPAPTPLPHATTTTTTTTGGPSSSRNSPHPTAAPAQQQQAPTQPIPHGSPTRVYLNTHVTPHLLEAMKHLATTEPEKPLKWLSEYLAQKSAEIEGV